jgi:hypothetical protein
MPYRTFGTSYGVAERAESLDALRRIFEIQQELGLIDDRSLRGVAKRLLGRY